jgi:hypothetical protein
MASIARRPQSHNKSTTELNYRTIVNSVCGTIVNEDMIRKTRPFCPCKLVYSEDNMFLP